MIPLLAVALLVLWPLPVLADTPQDAQLTACERLYTYCRTDGSGDVYGRNTKEEQWRVLSTMADLIAGTEQPNPLICLKQMEAAMRAMEMLVNDVNQRTHNILQRMKDPRIPITPQRVDTESVWKQWDAAKQCWGKP